MMIMLMVIKNNEEIKDNDFIKEINDFNDFYDQYKKSGKKEENNNDNNVGNPGSVIIYAKNRG